MQFLQFVHFRALVSLLTALTLLPGPVRHATHRHGRPRPPQRARPKLPTDYAQWSHVASCESGGWQVLGGAYPDSLGISRANFIAFGGRPLAPGRVSVTDRIMQIRTADRLIENYHTAVPDQYGCAAW